MNVLIAEDEPVSRRRLEAFLRKWGYTVSVAVDGVQALAALSQPGSPKIALLDRMMPHLGGLDVCRALRKAGAESYVYVILLTAMGQQEEVVEGLEAGADDYITKPFEIEELKARVRTGARIVALQEQLIATREQMRVEAMHDPLTRLLNRRAFFELFATEVARARRRKTPLAFIMGDIDNFKAVNDQHGHLVGDVVLGEVARRLRLAIRQSDVVGRYGGEEFAVVVPDCTPEQTLALAERFRAGVGGQPVDTADGRLPITMSFGVGWTTNMDKSDELVRTADQALYRAKDRGRNRVESEIFE